MRKGEKYVLEPHSLLVSSIYVYIDDYLKHQSLLSNTPIYIHAYIHTWWQVCGKAGYFPIIFFFYRIMIWLYMLIKWHLLKPLSLKPWRTMWGSKRLGLSPSPCTECRGQPTFKGRNIKLHTVIMHHKTCLAILCFVAVTLYYVQKTCILTLIPFGKQASIMSCIIPMHPSYDPLVLVTMPLSRMRAFPSIYPYYILFIYLNITACHVNSHVEEGLNI